jgi:hypothetical protein
VNADAAAAIATVEGEPKGPLARLWARVDDRLNPILVKEVRQSLRGRYFRNLFWLTVVAATGISVLRILAHAPGVPDFIGNLGPTFFIANFAVMTFAVNVFVPFWAFQSMGGEWEENTYDLLVISNLRPRQLIVGKTLAATVQAMLFFSAFAPFLVSTFLIGGVDLLSIAVVLAGTLCLSVALSMLAIAAASFGRSRFARATLAVLLIGTLIWLGAGSTIAGATLIQEPEILRSRGFSVVAVFFATILPLAAAIGFAVGCARLAHEHENRSTVLRAIVAASVLALLGWGVYGATLPVGSSPELLWVALSVAMTVAIVPFLFFATETEPLGRRVRRQVPKSKALALLALPFLPGGGRGIWLYLATAAACLLLVLLGLGLGAGASGFPAVTGGTGSGLPSWSGESWDTLLFSLALLGYGFVAIGFLPGLASFHVRSLRGRTGVRFAVPLAVSIAVLGPAVLGFLLDIRDWANFEHPLNPFHVLSEIDRTNGDDELGLALLAFGVAATIAVNAPRLWRSIGETLRAAAERRERGEAR